MDVSIDHLARLARLTLAEEEKVLYVNQLDSILAYMETLNGLDTTGVDATAHIISISNVLREDTSRPSLAREDALSNAPDRTDAFYRVPKIIE